VLIRGYFAITLLAPSPTSKWNYVVSMSETIGLVTNMDSMHTTMLVAIGDSSSELCVTRLSGEFTIELTV
jgi:hypothetical protein